MPYAIEKHGDKFAVITKGTGKVHGRFPSRAAAEGQLRALYVHAPPGEERKARGGAVGFQLERDEDHHFVARNAKGEEVRIAKKGLSKAAHDRYQRLCQGGEAKPMTEGGEAVAPKRGPIDLSRVRLVKESETHYHLTDHRGPFSVAKQGISKAMHAKIQAFAEGGESEGGSSSAAMPDIAPGDVTSTQPSIAQDDVAPPPAPAPEPTDPYYADWLASVQPSPPSSGTSAPAGRGSEPIPELGGITANDLAASNGRPPISPSAAEGVVPSPQPQPVAAPRPGEEIPGSPPGEPPPPLGEEKPTGPSIPGIPGMPKAPDAAATQKQIEDAYDAAGAAEQARADVAKQEAAKTLETQQTLEQHRQDLQKSWETTLAGWQRRGDDLRQAILDQKIDPERYWKDANGDTNVGRKVKAALGLIIGGLGSGLTHQPNAALQVIQAAIERDVDAQKAELGKKTTLLGYHMQQGQTLMAARQMAIADMKDAAAAQLAMVSTKFAGDKAQAAAQANIAALQRSAAMDRQSVAMQGFEAQFKSAQLGIARTQAAREQAMFPLQYEQAALGRNMARLQFGALQGLTAGQGGPSGNGTAMGTRIDPRAIPFLPKEYREALVTLPDGSYALAKTPKAAEETQKAIEAAGVLRDKMARYGALLTKHPHGVSSTISPEDYATAEALRDSILTDINGLAGLNRFTDTEAKLYSGRVPDITSKQLRASAHQAKLSELGKEIDDKIWETNRSWLNLPTRKRTIQ